ncbi:hypothetical protein ACQ4PT_033480 [Festuca glaucescens]
MELAAGAMLPLLGKLGQLLSDEYNLSKKVKKGISSVTTELTMMEAALLKVAEVPRDQLDKQVRIWARKVRELSYEMEDTVDAFMVHLEEAPDIGRARHRYDLEMHDTLRQRCDTEMRDNGHSAASIDPRLMAMYKDVTELVGIEDTRDEVVKMLIGGEGWKKRQLKIVSIVGFGGLGKTTLAKAVYEKIKYQFDCRAFVSVSQSPDIKRVFKDMLYELDKNKYEEIHRTARGEKQLLDELVEFLKNKRYFIVIDDIWDEKVWRLIRLSLQNGMEDTYIRQLATTSMSQVRSIALFQPAVSVMPSLLSFGVLRVLDLDGCKMSKSWYKINLKYVGNLLHLRYLGLDDLSIEELPVEIGKLQYLQMLELSGCLIDELPSSVILLRHLVSLHIRHDTKTPIGIGELVCLEELSYLQVDSNNAKELGHLTELRVLSIECRETGWSIDEVMAESLGNLPKLQNLFIHCSNIAKHKLWIMLDDWVPGLQLRRFSSTVVFPALPAWINSSSLALLSELDMIMSELQEWNIQAIGRLPALRSLQLGAEGGLGFDFASEEEFVVSADSFPCIKKCEFDHLQILPSMFPRGAMPMVQFLRFTIRTWKVGGGELNLGMGNLPCLEDVQVDLRWDGRNSAAMKAAETALKLAMDAHPNRLTLIIGGDDYESDFDTTLEESSSSEREEEDESTFNE